MLEAYAPTAEVADPGRRVPVRPARRRWRRAALRAGALVVLLAGALVILAPFVWMLSVSFEHMTQVLAFPPTLIPAPWNLTAYARGLTFMPFAHYFWNSLFIGLMTSAGGVLSASLAGYAFARLRSGDREVLFVVVLSALMLPYTVTMIPQYVLFKHLHWINTFLPLWVPAWFGGGAFFIFLFRQFFLTIPAEVFEAARIDGCGYFDLYWRVLLPLSKPVLATAAIFHFQFAWSDFLGPLIYVNSSSKYTVSLALSLFQARYGATPWNQLMAVSLLSILPLMLLFFLGQKYVLSGIVVTQR